MNIEKQLSLIGQNNYSEYIKLLLYKRDNSIFDVLDFENDKIFLDPLFFAFFNEKTETNHLESIIYGYQKNKVYKPTIEVKTDRFGRIYLPNIGWIITKLKEEYLTLEKECLVLKKKNKTVEYEFENRHIIEGTNIEVLKYPIPLLEKSFYNTKKEIINVEIEEITKKHIENLTKAYNLIKEFSPAVFDLIQISSPKCVIFNVDTYQRNSFADVAAHGIAFYNAYQKDYNEVFFVDDIAHQTGHVIFTNIISEIDKFLKVNKNTILETIHHPNGTIVENRHVEVIFHALYTYYTTFTCLDNCLNNEVFHGKREHEALGRICFYLGKCYRDLLLIDDPISSDKKSNEIFTKDGLILYNMIKRKWIEMYEKWMKKVKDFDMSNQPYNFTYSKFSELNPYNEDNF